MWNRGFALLAVTAAAVALAAVSGRAVAAPSGVVADHATPDAHSYSKWAARWWEWALTQPVATNPVLDTTGADCAQGQSGRVWYLAGSFGSDPVTRTCTVPEGDAILIPVVNYLYCAFTSDPKDQRKEQYVRAQVAAADVKDATVAASIDGVDVPHLESNYEESIPFSVTVPADNLFGLDEGSVLEPCADAGYYVFISPLASGEHTISVSGALPGGFSVDVTYHLTIA